jgi:hypothetical protein
VRGLVHLQDRLSHGRIERLADGIDLSDAKAPEGMREDSFGGADTFDQRSSTVSGA